MGTSANILAIGMPGGWEWIVIGLLGLLIFGNRLPEVGRKLGEAIVGLKKGLQGVKDEIDNAGEIEEPPPTRKTDEETRSG